MYDPRDLPLLEEERRRLDAPYGPDAKGSDMARSLIVLGVIVAFILGGLWFAGA